MFDNEENKVYKSIIDGTAKPPFGFYRKSKNRKGVVRFLVEQCLNRQGDDRLLPLKVQDFRDFNLYSFLTTYYSCSPKKALQEAYSEELIQTDVFNDPEIVINNLFNQITSEPPRGFWCKPEHRHQTVKMLVKKIQKSLYEVTAQDFYESGLAGFLSHYYKGNLNQALQESFPEAKFFLFKRIDPKIWQSKEARIEAINYFLVQVPQNNKKITMKTLTQLGLKQALAQYYQGDVQLLLAEVWQS